MIFRLSYWFLPVLSGAVWLGMLLGMLIGWIVDTHRYHYVSMDPGQTVAYISDIGASSRFKPMFIALCAVTTVTLDLSFLADRWLRHSGRLTPNGSRGQKVLAVLTILFALVGTAGLVLLSIFDVAHHKSLHDAFLLCFLGGYVLSAVFICWEYQRLGIHNRHLRILRVSFWIKLSFVLIEVVLAIIFVSLTFTNHATGGAVVEWIIAFIFALYIFSFCVDLYPAVHTRDRKSRFRGSGEKSGGGELGYEERSTAAGDGAAEFTTAGGSLAAAGATEGGNGGYRGYFGGAGAVAAAPRDASGYYENDETYGASAARATRAPRSNSSAFAEDGLKNNSSAGSGSANAYDGRPLSQPPQAAYQPGRLYQ